MPSISILMAFFFTSPSDRHLFPFLTLLLTLKWYSCSLNWWECVFLQQSCLCWHFSMQLDGLRRLLQPLFLVAHPGPLGGRRCPLL